MLFCETATEPVHVDMSTPTAQAVVQDVMAEITRANGILDHLMQTSPTVTGLICRLVQTPSAHDRTSIEDQLREEFQSALHQGGVIRGMVAKVAHIRTHNIVRDIQMTLNVKALYELGQMMVSGAMHEVYEVAMQSVARNVTAEEFNVRLSRPSSPQEKGLSADGHQ